MDDRENKTVLLIDDEEIYEDEPLGKLNMVCGTPFKGETDQKIIDYVASLGHMPTPEEVAAEVGCSVSKARRTLSLIRQQIGFAKGRKAYFEDKE